MSKVIAHTSVLVETPDLPPTDLTIQAQKITDAEAGTYDVKFVDRSGRTCIVPNVQVKAGSIFSIEEKELKGCTK